MSQFINLVNPALLPPKPFFQFRSMMLSLAAVALVLVILSVFIRASIGPYVALAAQAQQRLKLREAAVQALTQKLGVRQKNPQLALDLAAGQAELARLQQIVPAAPGSAAEAEAAASLQALSAATLPGVWLQEIRLQAGQLSLRGYALNPELVPRYLDGLRRQEAFHGQKFASFELGRKQFEAATGEPAREALEFSLQAVGGRLP